MWHVAIDVIEEKKSFCWVNKLLFKWESKRLSWRKKHLYFKNKIYSYLTTMIVALEMEALSSFATHLSSSSFSLSTFSPKINHSHRLSLFLSFSRSKRQQWASKEAEAAKPTKREATTKPGPGPSSFFLFWAIWEVCINDIKQRHIFQKSIVKYRMSVTFHIFTNILSKLCIFDNFPFYNDRI